MVTAVTVQVFTLILCSLKRNLRDRVLLIPKFCDILRVGSWQCMTETIEVNDAKLRAVGPVLERLDRAVSSPLNSNSIFHVWGGITTVGKYPFDILLLMHRNHVARSPALTIRRGGEIPRFGYKLTIINFSNQAIEMPLFMTVRDIAADCIKIHTASFIAVAMFLGRMRTGQKFLRCFYGHSVTCFLLQYSTFQGA